MCDIFNLMKRLFLVVFFFLLFSAASDVEASILVISKEGVVVWKVLSEETALVIPQHSFLEVKEIANSEPMPDASVSLKRDGEKITLRVATDDDKKELDVSGWKNDLVEIEERPETERIIIGLKEEGFSLEQRGIMALTDFSLNVDAKTAKLSALTSSGEKYISVLPFGAVESMIRAGLISRLLEGEKLYLTEQGRELAYKVRGEKVIDFFNIFSFSIPVTAQVSASTGQLLLIEEPKWFRVLNFLFV